MSQDDVLFGYRLQLFDLAGRIGVAAACRTFGLHRSTYYEWKRKVDRQGLEMLRPRERRRPRMPNQLSPLVEQRIVAFALAHPGFGPRRISAELGREKWGGLVVSANGVWRCLRRHGLNTRAKRLSLVAGYRAPTSRPASLRQSGTSRRRGRASWSASTASSSAACTAHAAPCGS
jgi:transposase